MNRNQTNQRRSGVTVVVAALLICCVGVTILLLIAQQASKPSAQPAAADQRNAALAIAYSPEKATLMKALAEKFNSQKQRTPDRQIMQIELVELTPEEMVNQALAGDQKFQALTPDSSLWLDQLNRRWAQTQKVEPGTIEPRLTGTPTRFAITPIVIAAWEDAARGLGWPDKPVSWQALQTKAQQDKNFRWSHPSTAYASGLLATLAEFYAGAGVQRGLTAEMAQDQKTLDFVSAVEKTVRFYGEGELAVMQRAAQDGPKALDAFVVSEQLVTAFNTGAFAGPFGGNGSGGRPSNRLVALSCRRHPVGRSSAGLARDAGHHLQPTAHLRGAARVPGDAGGPNHDPPRRLPPGRPDDPAEQPRLAPDCG